MAVLEIVKLLEKMVQAGGSDIFIASGAPPRMNVEGKLQDLSTVPLSPDDTKQVIRQILTEEQWNLFLKQRELNIAYSLSKMGRFRVNVYLQQGTVASVIRQIQVKIPNFEQLHLPPLLEELILSPRGLILVTGATGTGKSTTMAAMIDFRASKLDGHIVTVEDPIEYVFQHRKSLVTQREVGMDTFSFKEALKNSLRQAPNVIYIGELRDSETVEFSLHSAETGHWCFPLSIQPMPPKRLNGFSISFPVNITIRSWHSSHIILKPSSAKDSFPVNPETVSQYWKFSLTLLLFRNSYIKVNSGN
ncbi:MAG: ATPase, T2SS/T4P/T4SS family [Thermodesulfobacteriota bacterium]|jgi:twitching motility protein PilU